MGSQNAEAGEAPRRGTAEDLGDIYRLRIELDGTEPPLWRRVEVSSRLHLDQLHDVLQVVIGWTDSHLHRFASHPDHREDTSYYLCPFDVAEGDEGTPEERVRIDDVLAAVGDRLYYQYDYGDDWRHTLELEVVAPAGLHTPPARCVDGERPGPPEDCGGVEGYELMVAISDPNHPDHEAAGREHVERFGWVPDPADAGLVPFEPDAVNLRLAKLDPVPRPRIGAVPAQLEELVRGVLEPRVRRALLHLIAAADLDRRVEIDPDTAAGMVRPYRWLLDRVGDEGIRLTDAGYLPPAHVRAAFVELGIEEEWIGAGNRESETLPVLALRESAQEFGLLRKVRGRLLATRRGLALRTDPVALWHHLAERMPVGRRDEATRQAAIALLLAVAAGVDEDPRPLVADVLTARRWQHRDGTALTSRTVGHLLWDNLEVLRRLGAVRRGAQQRWPGTPTPGGTAFARAAVSS